RHDEARFRGTSLSLLHPIGRQREQGPAGRPGRLETAMKIYKAAATAALFLLSTAFAVLAQDKPTDPQIAHIAYTAGLLDIEAAKLALSKSSNKAVTDFAQSMVDDHQAVNEQALELVEKLGVTPEDNPTSQALSQAAEQKRAE